ncbi:MAG: hypothetical protein JO061_23355 [Acidobacteriaceae bacterium]|nr:hypothetical protein [Acidobacteriaceae bacterium]
MRSKASLLLAFAIFLSSAAYATAADDQSGHWLDVVFPHDSPVLPVSFSLGPTSARPRGISIAVDIHASLYLRNTGTKTISGLTLRVEAQDITPSGRGSVTVPSLLVHPGDVFPVRIDMELLRPFNSPKTAGSMVQVSLDCALFSDLTAYGPDQLGSRRALMVYELQARRDRAYLAKLIQSGRWTDVREELNFGLEDFNPQQLGLELLREPRPVLNERSISISAVSFPSSPVKALGGAARVTGNEVRTPQIDIQNGSRKMVRNLDMGWIIRDERGRDFVAGSTPATVQLAPVQQDRVRESATLRFSGPKGQPMLIEGLMAFVNDVEFGDGSVWIPTRSDIDAATNDPILRRALATSPEQQRLADVYRKRGLSGLIDELRKVN